jgi:hypothetical protein
MKRPGRNWAYWSGRSSILHLDPGCMSAPFKKPMIPVRIKFLHLANFSWCKRCVEMLDGKPHRKTHGGVNV